MNTLRIIIASALSVLSLSAVAQEQRTIVISDSLSARSSMLPVKLGVQWKGMYKMQFGDYGVGERKGGWVVSTQKSALFNRKTESSSIKKFYFELNGPANNTARVNAANSIATEALREWIFMSYSKGRSEFSIGTDAELLLEENTITAFITINDDSTDVWSLVMTTFKGKRAEGHYDAVALFSNGARKIYLTPVTSNDKGQDKRSIPAYGYELTENTRGVGALQFYGGGVMGMNKNIVWLANDVDDKERLLFAAALATVLQYKMDNPDFLIR
jgi:hypothetical protein